MKPDFLFQLRVRLFDGTATITAWDANHTDRRSGHQRIDAQLHWRPKGERGSIVFPRGATHCAVSRYCPIDGIEARELVMSLFAMRPGDTDRDYFDGYTPEQLEWAIAHGEELWLVREDRYCDPETGMLRRAR